MQTIPTCRFIPLTRQLINAGHTPDVRCDTVIFFKDLCRRLYLAQNGTGAEQLHQGRACHRAFFQTIQAAYNVGLHVVGHIGVDVVLVHRRDVIKNILALLKHPPHTILNNHGQFVSVGWIVTDAIGYGRCQ